MYNIKIAFLYKFGFVFLIANLHSQAKQAMRLGELRIATGALNPNIYLIYKLLNFSHAFSHVLSNRYSELGQGDPPPEGLGFSVQP